jgi:glutamate decarboxylase
LNKVVANLEQLLKVFTKPEGRESKLVQIEKDLSDNLANFLSQHVVAKNTSLEQIETDFQNWQLPEEPQWVSENAQFILDKLVANSVNTSSPHFIGHMTSALPYFHLSLAKLLVGLNQNLVKIETSKAFTPMERQVIGMLHELVYGQTDGFYQQYLHSAMNSLGTFCSGGTVANLTALWVARNKLLGPDGAFKGVAKDGIAAAMGHYGYKNLAIISSQRGHYSLGKAVDLLGLGRKNHISLSPEQQTLDPQKTLEWGKAYQAQGNRILAIVGVAGTTETGHIDPLSELADVALELGCAFHVDAAWGGATLFSNNYRHLLKGIERADSVTIDAHKQMYVPMGAGIVLFKDPADSNHVRHHAEYILRSGSKDLGSTSVEGSRNGMAMMVHSSMHILGRQGYQLLIDRSLQMARKFAQLIDQHPDFELVTSPVLCLLTYRIRPRHLRPYLENGSDGMTSINSRLNELTVTVQKRQREAGKSFVSRTRINTQSYGNQAITVFRVVLANPLTQIEHLQEILTEQLEIANLTHQWEELFDLPFVSNQ